MKTITLLGAAAIATIFASGCTDDKAMGEERTRDGAHLAPAQHDDVLHAPAQPQGQAAPDAKIPSEAPDPQSRRQWNHDVSGERAAAEPQVINGEDLTNIPDQTEPLWNTDPATTPQQRTPMDEKGKTQVVGKPGEPKPVQDVK